jgi:hypothetical protein
MNKVSPEHNFFFAVGSPETSMSSVWKVTAKQGEMDVYISESGSGQQMHVSLHANIWQVTVWKEFTKHGRNRGYPNPAKRPTHPVKWSVSEIAPGLMMPFRLLIPTSELRPQVPGWRAALPVRWLDQPPANFVYEIRFYLINRPLVIQSPDGAILELWKRPLKNGWELVVLAKALQLPDQEWNNIELMRQQGLLAAGPLPESALQMVAVQEGRLRGVVLCSADDGSRHFIDLAVDAP